MAAPGPHSAPAVQHRHPLDAVGSGALDVVVQLPELVADALDIVDEVGELQRQLEVAAVADPVDGLAQNGPPGGDPVLFGLPNGSPLRGRCRGRNRAGNAPSVYLTPSMSEMSRRVLPLPTLPTTASRPMVLNSGIEGSVPIQWSPRNIMASQPHSWVMSTISLASLATSRRWKAWKSRYSLLGTAYWLL